MDILTANTRRLFKKYLSTSIFAALATTIYCFVDTIAIGQSEGPIGAAAVAAITPVWGITTLLAALCGIGGSVQMSVAKGAGEEEKGNAYFTAALCAMAVIIAVCWAGFALFKEQVFTFFGADAAIMPKVMEYAQWIIRFFPLFILTNFMGAFLRNDGAPGRAMAAVLSGGCLNICGDWLFVFPFGMGMEGAAIATVLGSSLQAVIMASHFFTKRCSLRLVRPFHMMKGIRQILAGGFGASVLEFGVVLITILMNNQIMRYGGTTELAVYGVIVTISALFQAIFGGVGQALQPLVSANYGADRYGRVKEFWKMAAVITSILCLLFCGTGLLLPTQIVKLFIKATPEVLAAAPGICRIYFLTFIPLGFSVLSIYYLQSIRRDKTATLIAVLRSIVISGLFILVLPVILDIWGLWIASPLAEFLTAVFSSIYVTIVNKRDLHISEENKP